jgi:hypothetical protein
MKLSPSAALMFGVPMTLCLWSSRSRAAQPQVDLKLVLAMDVSGSIDNDELQLQREGTADAFLDPDVIKALRLHRADIIIRDRASAAGFAEVVRKRPRSLGHRTSVSSGLELGSLLLESSVSRDDTNNAANHDAVANGNHHQRLACHGPHGPAGKWLFSRRILDSPVHTLHLAVGPRMLGLGEAMIDIVLGTSQLEGVAEEFLARHHRLDLCRTPAFAPWIGEVDAIVGEHGMNFVGNSFEESP